MKKNSRKKSNAEKMVRLIHIGDPEKMWDPENPDVKYGNAPKGEDEDAIVHYTFDGEDGKIEPGEVMLLTYGEAKKIISFKTQHYVIPLKNKLTGAIEPKQVDIPPPLQIDPLRTKPAKDKSPIGKKLADDEAKKVLEEVETKPVPRLPDGYEVAPKEEPRVAKLGPKPNKVEAPVAIGKEQLDKMSRKNLNMIAETIGLTFEGKPPLDDMRKAIFEAQKGQAEEK